MCTICLEREEEARVSGALLANCLDTQQPTPIARGIETLIKEACVRENKWDIGSDMNAILLINCVVFQRVENISKIDKILLVKMIQKCEGKVLQDQCTPTKTLRNKTIRQHKHVNKVLFQHKMDDVIVDVKGS